MRVIQSNTVSTGAEATSNGSKKISKNAMHAIRHALYRGSVAGELDAYVRCLSFYSRFLVIS